MPFKLAALCFLLFCALRVSAVTYYISAVSETNGQFFANTGKAAPLTYTLEFPAFSFDIEQTLNIGSQSSGAGAGKVTFNPLTIKRTVDQYSPLLFKNCAMGTAFKTLTISVVGSGGSSNFVAVSYVFSLVAVKTISIDSGDASELPSESVSFEYGALEMDFTPRKADGTAGVTVAQGWNRVKNVACLGSGC